MTNQEANEKVPIFSWTGACGPLIVGPIALVVLATLMAPQNILDVWSIARRFVTWMMANFPWISEFANSTNYQQPALLASCLTVAFFPWAAFIWFIQSFVNYKILLRNQRRHRTITWKFAFLAAFVGAPLFFILIRLAFSMPGDPSWAKGFGTESRVGFSFLMTGLLYPGGMIVGVIPMMFRMLIDLDFKKE